MIVTCRGRHTRAAEPPSIGRQQYIDCKLHKLPDQALFHQAPPCLEMEGWLDLRKGESYTLEHYIIVLHPAYTFNRALTDYVRRLQPLEHLPPRYPWRYFLDKCLWTLRYTSEVYDDHGEWGIYWKMWYNLTNCPMLSEHGGKATSSKSIVSTGHLQMHGLHTSSSCMVEGIKTPGRSSVIRSSAMAW